MPHAEQRIKNAVERKIYFYRVDAGLDEAGRPLPFDPDPALRHITGLPFSEDGRYLVEADNNATCCWVDSTGPSQRLRWGEIRRSGLPQVEQLGSLSDLAIPANSGLVEVTHVVFFPHNIVGCDFNFHGPRVSRLGFYLGAKAGGKCPWVTFEPLLRQDVLEQLNRLGDVRLLELKIRASYAATVAEANRDLGAAFEAAARAGDAEELEIVLRPRRYSRGTISDRILNFARRLAPRADARTEASKFKVAGLNTETRRVEVVDLLRDQLIVQKQIIRQSKRGRALKSDSAYEAIETAYEELGDQLEKAAGLQP